MTLVFQPHIHGRGVVTTPDLVLDRCLVLGAEGPTGSNQSGLSVPLLPLTTSPDIDAPSGEARVVPAIYFIAAGFGPLLGCGAVLRGPPDGPSAGAAFGLKILSRSVWRLNDVADHLAALRVSLEALPVREGRSDPSRHIARTADLSAFSHPPQDSPRGVVFVGLVAQETPLSPGGDWRLVIALSDPRLSRSVETAYRIRTVAAP
jgi:hypothetical protein